MHSLGLILFDALDVLVPAARPASGVSAYAELLAQALEALETPVKFTALRPGAVWEPHPHRGSLALLPVVGADVIRLGGGTHRAFLHTLGKEPGARDAARMAKEDAVFRGHKGLFVAPSYFAAAAAMTFYGVDSARVHVIPNPVRMGRRTAGAENATGRLIRTVATGWRHKGIDRVLKLAARAGELGLNWRFEIAGRGHGVPARLRALGIRAPAVFAGVMRREEAFAGADLILHPARYEPFGNVVFEACARGIPVLASDQTGAAEYLPARCRVNFDGVEDGDVDAADAVLARMAELMDDLDLSAQLQSLMKPFTPEWHAGQILGFVQQAYGARRSLSPLLFMPVATA